MTRNPPRKLIDTGLRKTGYADAGDVESAVGDMPEKYLLCRELQHNWVPHGVPGRYRDGGFKRTLRCTRCSTKRIMEVDSRGLVDSSHYVHPEGYLIEGLGRIAGEARGVLRLASIKNSFAKGESKLLDRPEEIKSREAARAAKNGKPAKVAKKAPAKKTAAKKTTAKGK